MATATLTSKAQLTLPKPIRERLRVRPGDTVDFVVTESGDILLRAGRVDVSELRGSLRKPGRKPVSLQRMDEVIRDARARRP
jgi:AbrB family looped-hinge helix DNA binding protein